MKKRDENDEYGLVLMNDIAKKVLSQNKSPDMNVKYCARLFERFGISRAPVVENGEIKGIVSYNSIVMFGMLAD